MGVFHKFVAWLKESTLGPRMCDEMLTSISVVLSKEFEWANTFMGASSTSWTGCGNIWQGNAFIHVKGTLGSARWGRVRFKCNSQLSVQMAFNFLGNLLAAPYQARITLQKSRELDLQCMLSENVLVMIIVLVTYRGTRATQLMGLKCQNP